MVLYHSPLQVLLLSPPLLIPSPYPVQRRMGFDPHPPVPERERSDDPRNEVANTGFRSLLTGASLRNFGITEFPEGQEARILFSYTTGRHVMRLYVLELTARVYDAWCLPCQQLLQRNVIFRDSWWVCEHS
jgi:hypothetical protein